MTTASTKKLTKAEVKALPLTKKIAKKVLQTVDAGLVCGIGKPEPGKMCVEAAVCYAYGLEHNDKPPCVGWSVRQFKIELNDCYWSTIFARAEGMRKLSIAQLGSNKINQKQFTKTLVTEIVRAILPIYLRKIKQEKLACLCEKEPTIKTVYLIYAEILKLKILKLKIDDTVVFFFKVAMDSAFVCDSHSCAAGDVAIAIRKCTNALKYSNSIETQDLLLKQAAEICLKILIDMKSPGCKYLYLCD